MRHQNPSLRAFHSQVFARTPHTCVRTHHIMAITIAQSSITTCSRSPTRVGRSLVVTRKAFCGKGLTGPTQVNSHQCLISPYAFCSHLLKAGGCVNSFDPQVRLACGRGTFVQQSSIATIPNTVACCVLSRPWIVNPARLQLPIKQF